MCCTYFRFRSGQPELAIRKRSVMVAPKSYFDSSTPTNSSTLQGAFLTSLLNMCTWGRGSRLKRIENDNSHSSEPSLPPILCKKVQGTGSIEQLRRVARGVQSCQRACRCASKKNIGSACCRRERGRERDTTSSHVADRQALWHNSHAFLPNL